MVQRLVHGAFSQIRGQHFLRLRIVFLLFFFLRPEPAASIVASLILSEIK